MIEAIASALGISAKSFLAGLLGGIVSLRFFDQLGWKGRVFTVLAGGVVAGYATPIAIEFAELAEKHDGFMGFVLGLFGMSIASAIYKAISSADLWAEIVARLPGRRKDK